MSGSLSDWGVQCGIWAVNRTGLLRSLVLLNRPEIALGYWTCRWKTIALDTYMLYMFTLTVVWFVYMMVYGYLYMRVNSQVRMLYIYYILFLKHEIFNRYSKLVGCHGAGEVFLLVDLFLFYDINILCSNYCNNCLFFYMLNADVAVFNKAIPRQ